MQLKDKVALVTGGGRGIGRAIAMGFAAEGAQVTIAARSTAQLDEGAAAIAAQGGEVLAVPTDLRVSAEVERLVQQTVERFGRIDILVNNAGVNPRGLFLDATDEEWEQAWQINVMGVVRCCRAVLPIMQRQGSGNIINVGSGMGQVGHADLSVYCVQSGLARVDPSHCRRSVERGHHRQCAHTRPGQDGAVKTILAKGQQLSRCKRAVEGARTGRCLGTFPRSTTLGQRHDRPDSQHHASD